MAPNQGIWCISTIFENAERSSRLVQTQTAFGYQAAAVALRSCRLAILPVPLDAALNRCRPSALLPHLENGALAPFSRNSAPYLSWLFAGTSKAHIYERKKKLPRRLSGEFFLCWHLPILPGRFQPSIVGTSELNCRVRDGNGCTLTVISTN